MFEQIIGLIKKYDCIIIHRHGNPDGDALGAQIGLKHIIADNFPSKRAYAVGDGAGRYVFMQDSRPDEIDDATYSGALAIILDTSAKALISDTRYVLAAETARLDHHIFCEKIAGTELTDTSFESCCGMVTALAMEGGLAVSALAAKSLYTGMVTDSGRFRYDSTSPRTFTLASFLLSHDFSTADVYSALYADTIEHLRLRASFILKIRFTAKNVAYIYTDAAEAAACGADTFTISRGMVGTMSDISGVSIWANFTETENGVICELRSDKYNINPVAVKYGGGGHAKASGATLRDRAQAMALLADLDALTEGENE